MEISVIIAIVLEDWPDVILVTFLLLVNAAIGYYEETNAGDAVAALMDQLSPTCRVKRDGKWVEIDAAKLVAGDIVAIRLGDIVPADLKLLKDCEMVIDQSSLTGESEPARKMKGEVCFSGSIVKRGANEGLVFATGERTFFGQALDLLSGVEEKGSLQIVLTRIGNFCISIIFIMVVIELIVQLGVRSEPCSLWIFGGENNCQALGNTLVLIIGGIPIAMPTVLSVTMALGAIALAKKDAIVTRLTAIEELASMDILCSDKTGTLTLNELTIRKDLSLAVNSHTDEETLFYGAVAAKPENGEPIDVCVFNQCPQKSTMWEELERLDYVPFDPINKRTIASIRVRANGNTFRAVKGAPWVILDMDAHADRIRGDVEGHMKDLAERGYRSLGVGVSRDSAETPLDQCKWEMVGIIAMQDPPRHDSGETIKNCKELGVEVKMITGDQLAIGKETCNQLGIASNLLTPDALKNSSDDKIVETADGFAEVFPQHKFEIVSKLQGLDHVTGMTGDGVNDAPALKKADIGIAVADATDAARAAADIVLLSPGLSVILDAIRSSRKIFERMQSYAVYSVSMTVRIILCFGLLTAFFNWYFPSLVIVILAVLNDGTILTIAKDRVEGSAKPVKWNLKSIFTHSIAYGVWLTIGTIALFTIVYRTDFFKDIFGVSSLKEFPGLDCDKNMNWPPADLRVCNPLNIEVPSGASYEDDIYAAYRNLDPVNENEQLCKVSLHHEMCHIEQNRDASMRGLIYIFVSVTGQATIFITRTSGFSWKGKPSMALLIAFTLAQIVATIIGAVGFGGYPYNSRTSFLGCSWGYAAIAWLWALIFYFPMDFIKFMLAKLHDSDTEELYMMPEMDRKHIKAARESQIRRQSIARQRYSKVSSRISRRASQMRLSQRRASQMALSQRGSTAGLPNATAGDAGAAPSATGSRRQISLVRGSPALDGAQRASTASNTSRPAVPVAPAEQQPQQQDEIANSRRASTVSNSASPAAPSNEQQQRPAAE